MNDFAHDNLGICYWNGTLGPFNLGVVGFGPGLKIIADIAHNEAFREFLPDMQLCAVSNLDEGEGGNGADGIVCPVYESYTDMLREHPEINLVVEMTGNKQLFAELRQSLPDSISLMDHREVVFFCGLHDMAVVKGHFRNHMDHQRTLIQSIIDEIREDIFLLDKSGNIEDLNRIVWERAGKSRKELLGKSCWQAARLRDGSPFCHQLDPACPFHKTLQSGQKEEALVTRVNGEGLLQYYRLYAYPIFDMRGTMSHVMVMHRDITDRTRREKYQQQQDKFSIIGEMSTYLAHEIRNPLFAVGGFANSLLRSPNLGEKEKEKIQIIVDETKRLDRMLANMLSFARPSMVAESTVNILAVCQDVAELMSVGYGKQGYRIEVESSGPLPSVQGDGDALKQCLVNIIKNSIEAMPDGGLVCIRLGMEKEDVLVEVRDQGVGMTKEEQEKAFNPFYSTKADGTGLGLAMIKKIVEEFGGTVGLSSRYGQGTTVSLHLCPATDGQGEQSLTV